MHYPIYIVDDEAEVRSALAFMLAAGGAPARSFAGVAEFLEALPDLEPGCLLIDIRMPGRDGIELLAELKGRGIDWPAVIMTGHGEVPLAVQAIRGGAVDFIEKPFEEELLQACLAHAVRLLDGDGRAAASG
jgi:two-component system response regulator FixJ